MSLLQHLHNHELVLREHLGKAISLLNQVFSILEALWDTLAFLGLCVVAKSVRHTALVSTQSPADTVQHRLESTNAWSGS